MDRVSTDEELREMLVRVNLPGLVERCAVSMRSFPLEKILSAGEPLLKQSTMLLGISHHPAPVRYHSKVLELKPEGEWVVQAAGDFQFTEDLISP